MGAGFVIKVSTVMVAHVHRNFGIGSEIEVGMVRVDHVEFQF